MTILKIVSEYHGGKGFVTAEQAIPSPNTLTEAVGFWVAGEPTPQKGQMREDKDLQKWRGAIQAGARMNIISKGKMGAFQPVSVILQFATDEKHRLDYLCRSTLDGLTHSGLLHDDSAIVDLVATRRPANQSPTGATGCHVAIIPGELIYGKTKNWLTAFTQQHPPLARKLVDGIPRTMPDKKKGDSGGKFPEWSASVERAFTGVKLPKRASLICEFKLGRWLEPDGIHYPIVNGRDVDKLSKSIAASLGIDLVDLVASKRLGEPGAKIDVYDGPILGASVLNEMLGTWGGLHGAWSTS
jgi:Holliday junction resolvase RusA-like endonuclease